ncbi:hypothetical protein ACFQ3P_13785 [Paraburkholderia sabiae]|uniref:Uncharacterized protein n=1 Tax=Paraburkholderia sabiae TaxID=273251 RepID=A0ABU9QD52_9BURK|nr:hypothetical protein [Paraburkholderia sabiae]WJZ76170.1 hypothetical protein QEN71_10325 [Paraburkholderia sabiae]CAD6525970.1 hypothetical protein LMG24235_01904 [Paraburkholderia sabiae]
MSKETPAEVLANLKQMQECIASLTECNASLKDADDSTPPNLRETWELRKGSCLTRLKELEGEMVGILMAHFSDDDEVMAKYDAFIADGGNAQHVSEGMKLVARNQKMRDKATGEWDRQIQESQEAWDALSTSEQRERLDNQRRIREGMGESQHHGEKRAFGPIGQRPGSREHKAG